MLSVLIVGCGNIAGGFDAGRPADAPPLTHAGAFTRHGGFRVAACVEPDAERRAAFMQRWDVPAGHGALGEVTGRFDVISLCSPTALHAAHLEQALALRPRLIFCEKPVTPSVLETERLVRRCAEAGVALAVNHTRRWAPDVQRLAEELQAGAWGALRSATGLYNKGVLNNGSHLVDLLHRLVGPLALRHAGTPCFDHGPDDPSVPALLQAEAGVPVQLSTAHAADGAVFELQLVTERALIAMEDGGLAWRVRRFADSPVFRGYRTPEPGERTPGGYLEATRRAVANLHAHLHTGEPLASTGDSALAAQRLCERIRQSAH